MPVMRESWTDARLDDYAASTERRFDAIDAELRALNARFDALNRTLHQVGGGIIATLIAGILAAQL